MKNLRYAPKSAFGLLLQLLDDFSKQFIGQWDQLADPKTPPVDYPKIKLYLFFKKIYSLLYVSLVSLCILCVLSPPLLSSLSLLCIFYALRH